MIESEDTAVQMQSLRHAIINLTSLLNNAVSVITSHESKMEKYENNMLRYEMKIDDYKSKLASYVSQVELLHAELKIYKADFLKPNASITATLPQNTLSPPKVSCSGSEANGVVMTDTLAHIKQKSVSVSQNTTLPVPATSQAPKILQKSNQSLKIDISPRTDTNKAASNQITATATNIADSQPEFDLQPWTEVKRKPRRYVPLYGTADSSITSLKAKELKKYIHLWNMESGAEDIREYLRRLNPAAVCTVEELNPKGNYKSYKVGVPIAFYETCLSSEIWPINARIKPWVYHRQPRATLNPRASDNQISDSRPFRGPANRQ